MSPLRLNGSTSGYSQLDAPAIAGDQTFTLPGTGGTIDRLNRAGNILQVVYESISTGATSSSSTFADTGLTATITPTSASSKILVLVNQTGCGKETNNTWLYLRLLRNATTIVNFERYAGFTSSTASVFIGSCSTAYLDNPATTSATTYKTQFASRNNNSVVYINTNDLGSPSTSTITLMEVAA